MDRDSKFCWCGNQVDKKNASICSGCDSYQGDCDCPVMVDDY